MKKTISDYIETLPPRIKVKALRNIGKLNKNSGKLLDTEVSSLFSAINMSFIWSDTPEGLDYWTLVANGKFDKAFELMEKVSPHQYRESVHHFLYFIFNFPHEFWKHAFTGEPQWMQEHIEEKFHECYDRYGAVEGVVRFFMVELDTEKRSHLLNWVRDNYTGYKMKINTDGEKTNS